MIDALQRPIGFLYSISGLLVEFAYVSYTGAMLGMTTPIFSLIYLLVAPLISIGPSLLILVGITTLGPSKRRNELCLVAGGTLLIALAAWTIPRIGWRYSAYLILEPVAISLLAAWLVLSLVKRNWVSAVVGSALSSPFVLFGAVFVLYQNIFSPSPFSTSELVLIVPAIFVTLSLVSALRIREVK